MGLISNFLSTTKTQEKVGDAGNSSFFLSYFTIFPTLSFNSDNYLIEYDDDTTIIPRSTSVIARRLPAARPGKGGAARYVSGKMPVNARNASRTEPSITRTAPGGAHAVNNNVLELNNAQTEEEKINALMNLQASQWKEQQQEMAK